MPAVVPQRQGACPWAGKQAFPIGGAQDGKQVERQRASIGPLGRERLADEGRGEQVALGRRRRRPQPQRVNQVERRAHKDPDIGLPHRRRRVPHTIGPERASPVSAEQIEDVAQAPAPCEGLQDRSEVLAMLDKQRENRLAHRRAAQPGEGAVVPAIPRDLLQQIRDERGDVVGRVGEADDLGRIVRVCDDSAHDRGAGALAPATRQGDLAVMHRADER